MFLLYAEYDLSTYRKQRLSRKRADVHNCHGIVSPTFGWGTLGGTWPEMYTLSWESRSGDGSAYAVTTKGRQRPIRSVQEAQSCT
jgi:hypothetical protein